jgi:hypothetical protein
VNLKKLPAFGLRRFYRFGSIIIAGCGVLLSAASLQAAPIAPGALLFPAPPEPLPGGNIIGGGVPQLFNSATFSGTLTSTVLANDPTNPFGPNGLTFTYQLVNVLNSPGEIDRLTIASFANFLADAGQAPVAGNLGLQPVSRSPAYIDRSLLGNGATLGFSFAQVPLGFGTLQPGETSDLLVVHTNATSFAASTANVIDGSVEQVPTVAPIMGLPTVPEPSSIILAVLAGTGLLVLSRRRA